MSAPLSPAEFARRANVSRETLARLEAHLALLAHWQGTVNLVGRGTLTDPWRRHMLDSAQLFPLLPPPDGPLVDLGSGAGFPGLVLAILGAPDVHLVESDARKCAFLQEAARLTGAAVTIHRARAEDIPPLGARAVTARGCAPLPRLLALAAPHLAPGGVCLFHKGRNVNKELTAARKNWKMRVDRIPSAAAPHGVCLRIREIVRDPAARRPPRPGKTPQGSGHRQSEGGSR